MISHNKPYLDTNDQKAVLAVLKSNWIAQGKVSEAFENKTGQLLKRKYAKAVSSGTAALHLALLALGIKKGDEVVLSTYTCTALLNAIYYTGASPKIADIDERTLGLSKKSVSKVLSRKTKAIIVNHAFGYAADIKGIQTLGIPIIEDCAQALGSSLDGNPLGSFGDLTITSFYATKMIASGYGGMVLTNHRSFASRITDLTHYDQRHNYKVRYNYCLSDLNAALGLSQLAKLKSFVDRRTVIAKKYAEALQDSSFYYWTGRPGEKPNFYRFITGTAESFTLHLKKLKQAGIQAISPIEPYQLLHRYLKLNPKAYPVAEAISRAVISLPLYPALNAQDVSKVCSVLRNL
jgi:perosamine synthetase